VQTGKKATDLRGGDMKKVGLVLGVLLMMLSGIAFIVCLALPSLTNNRVNFEEALLGIIPAALIFFLAFIITIVFAVLLIIGRKAR
jgi:uncharacterized membrane protein YphA (DoxX/SURF4 family)